MLNLTEEQWDNLFNKVDETVTKAMDELPESTRKKAEEIGCIVDKYTNRPDERHLARQRIFCDEN